MSRHAVQKWQIELNPSFALGHLVHGMALYAGRAADAVPSLERGLGLNRFDPQNFVWSNILALACLFGDDAERALKFASMSLQVRPTWRPAMRPAMRTAAAACAAMGRDKQAAQWARKWSGTPGLSADELGPLWRCDPAWTRRFIGPGVSQRQPRQRSAQEIAKPEGVG